MEADTAQYWLSWIHRGGSIAMLLVAIGVGYEFVADRLAQPLSKIIEDARRDELARLHSAAAQANERAATANTRAAELEKAAEDERLEIARLNGETERLKGDNLALLKAVQPRRVPLDFKKIEDLRPFGGTRLLIQSVPDFEAQKLEFDIKWVVSRVGWQPESRTPENTKLQSLNIADGLRIYSPGFDSSEGQIKPAAIGTPERKTYDSAIALSEYLRAADVENSVQPWKAAPISWVSRSDSLLMVIGRQPVFAEINKLRWLQGLPDNERNAAEATEAALRAMGKRQKQ